MTYKTKDETETQKFELKSRGENYSGMPLIYKEGVGPVTYLEEAGGCGEAGLLLASDSLELYKLSTTQKVTMTTVSSFKSY